MRQQHDIRLLSEPVEDPIAITYNLECSRHRASQRSDRLAYADEALFANRWSRVVFATLVLCEAPLRVATREHPSLAHLAGARPL